ncbi:amiloride-sensitive sodium channel subunit alpha [Ixodes scapularis]
MNPWRKSKVCNEDSFVSKSAKALIGQLCNSVPRNVATREVEFPAVTVCNMNPWRKSKVCNEDSFVSKSAKALIGQLCNSVPRNVAMDEEDLELTQRLKTWISVEQRRNLSRAERLGHQIEDMILECRVQDGDCLSTHLLDLRLVSRYGNCYCLGCNSSRFSWQAMQMSDPEQGLQMSLNMEPDEFLPLTVEAGFYVMINQAGAREEVFDNAVYVPPGATTYIGVLKSTSKNLEPPFKNPCQKDWPEELKKYVAPGVGYTQRACEEYCYQVHIFEACGCRSFKHIRVLVPNVMAVPVCPDMLRGVVIGVGLDDTVGTAEPLQDSLGGGGRRVRIQWVVFFGPRSSTGKVGRDASLAKCMGENVIARENVQERRGDDRAVDDGTGGSRRPRVAVELT